MIMQRETRIALIGAVASVVLQIVLAPNIALGGVVPNLLVIYTLIIAMLVPGTLSLWMAFILGLLSDLIGMGPVGSTSLLLLIACFCVSRVFAAIADGRMSGALVTLVVFALLVNVVYSVFLVAASQATLLDALMYRALPQTLFECAMGLVAYPLLAHFLVSRRATPGTATPSLRLR